MRVISPKPLKDFSDRHPQARAPINAWYQEIKAAEWKNFADVKAAFGSADVVAGNRVIFNIGGNKYRLIVKIAYKIGVLYVKFIGTHKEYDKIDPETIELK